MTILKHIKDKVIYSDGEIKQWIETKNSKKEEMNRNTLTIEQSDKMETARHPSNTLKMRLCLTLARV